MIKINHSGHYVKRLWITEPMEELLSNLNTKSIEISLNKMMDSYYMTEEQLNRRLGPEGCCGYVDGPQDPEKPPYPEHQQYLSLKFKLSAGALVDEIKNIIKDFTVTPGNTYYCQPLKCQDVCGNKIKKTYIYKLPGFNQAFQALQLLIPDLTEEKFADDNNVVLISEEEVLDHELLKIVESVVVDKNNVQYYNVELNIISSDIKTNMQSILNIIRLCEPYLIR